MGAPCCRLLMSVAEDLFETDSAFQLEVESLLDANADPLLIVEAMAARLPDGDAATLRSEASELRPYIWRAMAIHWRDARDAGVPFHLESVAPDDILGAARRRESWFRVEESEDGGIVVQLSHIPGRHATWATRRRSAAS